MDHINGAQEMVNRLLAVSNKLTPSYTSVTFIIDYSYIDWELNHPNLSKSDPGKSKNWELPNKIACKVGDVELDSMHSPDYNWFYIEIKNNDNNFYISYDEELKILQMENLVNLLSKVLHYYPDCEIKILD